MQRIVVLGPGGSGKSTLARRLSAIVGLPVFELDKVFWTTDLMPMALDEWRRRQSQIAGEVAWIMDGDLGPYDDPSPRLSRADTVVLLDMALLPCAWRARRRGREGRDFWRWLHRWHRDSRGALLDAIDANAPEAKLVVLRSRREVERWLASIDQ